MRKTLFQPIPSRRLDFAQQTPLDIKIIQGLASEPQNAGKSRMVPTSCLVTSLPSTFEARIYIADSSHVLSM